MSGSSLDGVDIAYCEFYQDSTWHYEIIESITIPYDEEWVMTLKNMPFQQGSKLIEYDILYGNYIGKLVNDFLAVHKLQPAAVSSHGHTIFHNPSMNYTFQLGNGQAIATTTGMKTISDFRIGDIQLGGQGAPLVPIGDELLFNDYDFCINIGGIANISFREDNKRIAFDICPANQLLNYLSNQVGKQYDNNGSIAQLGKLDMELFTSLNNHPYYSLPFPKAISNQLIADTFISILDESDAKLEDVMYTVCKHIAFQINTIIKGRKKKILITGGGAHNSFLISAINNEVGTNIIVPNDTLIDFKEALIFAFMGVLRLENSVNCLASATGASRDSSSGVVYSPG